MRLVPSKERWCSWSLPSKLTAIGAYATIAGLLLTLVALGISVRQTENAQFAVHESPPNLEIQLLLRIDGFQIRVANAGVGPAKQVTVSLKTWQIGAPGPDIHT